MADGVRSEGSAESRWAWTEPGAFEVAPGVHRIPLPLPQDGLRAVNVYAVEDAGKLVLIDSGWALEEARDRLETAIGQLGYGFEDVHRFLITHIHRDHYTLGVTLRRVFGTRISLGLGERPSLETLIAGRQERQIEDLARSGAGSLIELLRQTMPAGPRQDGYEPPDEWIDGLTKIELEQRTLHALPTPGHTRGHVVFLSPDESLLFAGDHVLPHITPSIGFEPETTKLPLGDYLDSLRLIQSYPDARLLPAHGPVAASVHARVEELLHHHDERLSLTADAVADGAATAFEAAHKLAWTRRGRRFEDLDVFNQMLAVGETAAHLDLLVLRGLLRRSIVDDVAEYAVATSEPGGSPCRG
jgi:glyoxylase-like metal-dependent hydrolase (beta-lactamase superfamily II)